MAQGDSALKDRHDAAYDTPRKYKVILHNDDFTPMEFVVEILIRIFRKSQAEAVDIMLSVHNSGTGVAGEYSYDMAHTLASKAMRLARESGYPLTLSCQPV